MTREQAEGLTTRESFAAEVGLDPATLAALIADLLSVLAACGLLAADAPAVARKARHPIRGLGLRLRLEAEVGKHVPAARTEVVADNLLAATAALTPAAAAALCQ